MKPLIPDFPIVKFEFTDDFAIHGFGILVALGFMAGARMAMTKAARDGLDPEVINKVVGWLVAGVFIGGHMGHLLFYYPEQIREDPMVIFRVWEGLSSFGGFIGCTILGVWFLRREGARIRKENRVRKKKGEALVAPMSVIGYSDTMVYGFSVGWALGRTGCFVAHDHPGTATDFFLGVYGMCENAVTGGRMHALATQCEGLGSCIDKARYLMEVPVDPAFGQACHDLGLYEAIWSFSLIPLFYLLDKKPRFPGFFVSLWLLMYGPLRMVLDAFRTADTRYFGVTPAQIGCVVMVIGAALIIRANHKKTPIRTMYGGGPKAPPVPPAKDDQPDAEDAPVVDAVAGASASVWLDVPGLDLMDGVDDDSMGDEAPTELFRPPTD